MYRAVRRTASVVLAAVLLTGGACRQDREPLGPAATLPVGTTTTNPYAVPAVIDEVYVNRVLAGLDQAYGDITRIVVSTRSLPPEVLARLKALYVGDLLQLQIDLFALELAQGLPAYKVSPGNQRSVVTKLISVRPTCIFAEVSRDQSAVGTTVDERLARQWVALAPADAAVELTGYNPTSWQFLYDGFQEGFTQPQDPCLDAA